VFILPFVLARIFRPSYLSTFDLTNFEYGICTSIYGIVAFISYPFGGIIADKIKPHKLMAIALFMTALGGFYMATSPSFFMLKILYGYWGFTTIFLFWAAMIKATRIWGGFDSQGKAFGFLDGGRGLVAALFGSMGLLIFAYFIGSTTGSASDLQSNEAFLYVINISSVVVILVGLLVYFFLKLPDNLIETRNPIKRFENIKSVLKLPAVWLLMVIILCAYVGYKFTDIFSQYANEVMLYSKIDSAKTGTYLLFIRPIVGLTIGFLADRSRASKYLIGGFAISILGAGIYASGIIGPSMNFLFLFSIFITAIGIYAARVLYFAVMQEGKIPIALTGTAVGIISFIGYTPDIFAGPLMGYLLDGSPGELGYQHVFIALCIFSFIGLIASVIFYRIHKPKPD